LLEIDHLAGRQYICGLAFELPCLIGAIKG